MSELDKKEEEVQTWVGTLSKWCKQHENATGWIVMLITVWLFVPLTMITWFTVVTVPLMLTGLVMFGWACYWWYLANN